MEERDERIGQVLAGFWKVGFPLPAPGEGLPTDKKGKAFRLFQRRGDVVVSNTGGVPSSKKSFSGALKQGMVVFQRGRGVALQEG